MAGKRTILTAGLRRLSVLLSEMREQANLTKEEVSAKTGINVTTLYRIERAQARPQRRTLLTMLDLYGVDEARRKDALELLSDAQKPGMSRPYEASLTEVYAAYINFESVALSARHYQTSYVPGLLQTEQYALAVIDTTMPKVDAAIMERRARARMDRAAVLTKDDPLELWVVLDEAAIRRVVGGPEIMRGQLHRLLEEVLKKNVILQILPFDAGAHPGMAGAFTLLDFHDPADPELVYVEGIAGDALIEGHNEIRRFGVIFDQLRAMALSPRDSAALISEAASELS
ncbi:helix-turn-helix transcriptional regulator [Nocardia cyriacigeorgica]|uniref:Putative DNA-binding protein n=2 Tax=Nocardia TaxID=1817 RepID=H6R4W3_NOCCG|nr:helix-turn-helix transcriptional regulator [Nocardia cyriacigeorgica]MBF6081015.1 helix-turn-helix transcriptional regulator [Nocardia cyriacigeorgica]MBF6284898.1 helix-turn-helix transcriptional regulator [Nocardia cyriacigeorgica]MBF6423845.1 helix-turn-helix transcriptional regulator [Nocardia cyriacigeorgica]CCF64588.1 putative DNA-binding protein [Nocardia cyriacigeorgica GUH-2]BDU07661.1 transcriptional regulator [Nocardia cyriacigeorgica]